MFKIGFAIPQLPCADIEETAQFFSDKLGFEIVSKMPAHKFLIVRRDGAEIHYWQAPTREEAMALGRESSCYMRVENVGELFEELKDREAPFRYELTKQPWGMNEMQIDDPCGNAIRFGERV